MKEILNWRNKKVRASESTSYVTVNTDRQSAAPSFGADRSEILCVAKGESESVLEVRPPALTSISEPLSFFDGTTRLYICYICPYAQRAWIARNCKGLQDKIKLVPIDLKNRPSWYKEKVYRPNKVPSLEHNGKVLGESLDLIRYIDANFEGPALFPRDPTKREYGGLVISHVNTFTGGIYSSLKGDTVQQTSDAFDYVENALGKFDDGPFFLGQFSLVDIAYVSSLERFQIIFSEIFKHDITEGRPNLAKWIEEANKIDGYKQTKVDRDEYLEAFKKKILVK
ncbi:glutathione S-transferase L3-like [Abrus precatorius]|uniref:glutathione transferase n=1 Tax=Abrus precatorius TaxID=3816 RepID=A0A8B8KYZ0_ABRPR|nr:glutathione S-transferase L3-like [Abrus precatorius]